MSEYTIEKLNLWKKDEKNWFFLASIELKPLNPLQGSIEIDSRARTIGSGRIRSIMRGKRLRVGIAMIDIKYTVNCSEVHNHAIKKLFPNYVQ